nr:hypothetical protein [Candidatus Bathyarchaeota archaeon]
MIYAIWVLKSSGEPLIYKFYRKDRLTSQAPSLTGGFLTAIFDSMRVNTGEQLNIIEIVEIDVAYMSFKTFIVVVASDDPEEARRFAAKVGSEFKMQYSQLLDSWTGETSIFQPFIKKLDFLVKDAKRNLRDNLGRLLNSLGSQG